MRQSTGADILCRRLELLGVRHLFGLPGTQNVALFEALRRSSIRTIVPTTELAAGFMANGYYRASGKVGVLTTIPGPGFAYTVPAIAEAAHDSAAVLYIAGKPLARGKAFDLQVIDQVAILRPLVKRVFEVGTIGDLAGAINEAYHATTSGEPGPVLLQIAEQVMRDGGQDSLAAPPLPVAPVDDSAVTEAIRRIRTSQRIAIVAGQGAYAAGPRLQQLAELLPAPVLTTRSARGVIPEDHPLALSFRGDEWAFDAANRVLDASDLVVVIGCKLTHNGTYGFRLRLDPDKLIRIDASADVLKANYPAQVSVCAEAAWFLAELLDRLATNGKPAGAWTGAELTEFKTLSISTSRGVEPEIKGATPSTPAGLFSALRNAMPRESCLVTDTGIHQMLATKHFRVFTPRGMIIPSDFQSMGFGLPAAIGAKLAAPERPVVALIGDGGFATGAMELMTAVRERIPLTVIIFNDGALGQIRLQQMSSFGRVHGTELMTPQLELLAKAMGAQYVKLRGDVEESLRAAISGTQVTMIEVEVGDSNQMRIVQAKGLVRGTVRQMAGPSAVRWLKTKLRRTT